MLIGHVQTCIGVVTRQYRHAYTQNNVEGPPDLSVYQNSLHQSTETRLQRSIHDPTSIQSPIPQNRYIVQSEANHSPISL